MTNLWPFLLSFAILFVCLGNVFCVWVNNRFACQAIAFKYSVILKAKPNGYLFCVCLASLHAVT